MKKLFLLIFLLFQLTFVFGQERDEVGHRVTPWVIARHGCFNGLEWKVRKSYYSDNSNNFINEIEIKNKYSSKITFSFDVSADANAKTTQSRKTLNPGETTRFTRVQNVDFVYLYIADVCFNSDNRCTSTCYALCDNGIPNIPIDCGGQKSNSNNNSASQTRNSTTYSDKNSSVQINKTQPNQTTSDVTPIQYNNTDVLDVLESTTNQITNALSNSLEKSKSITAGNELEIKNAQKEFQENNLTDKEIDSLLTNPDPANYATVNIYKEIKCCHWYTLINGRKLPILDGRNKKIEYRVYTGTKLLIQAYPVGGLGSTLPIKSVNTRIRKGKTYYFIIKKIGMADFSLEQIDEEPLDKKGNIIYKNLTQNIKSDID